jgi:flagellar hook-associated protein 2
MAISIPTNRISGLASGLDTDSLVKSMLATYQTRLDKQNQTTTKLQWKADALRSVNSLIKTFRESNLSVLNASSNMLSKSSYSAFDVAMLTTTSAVTVKAGSSAAEGKVTINEISKLAASATLSGTDVFSTELNKDDALKDLAFKTELTFDTNHEVKFSINDIDFTFSEDTLLSDMMSEINASDAGVKISYSSLKDGFTLTSKSTGSASEIKIENTSGNMFSYTDTEGNAVAGALGIEQQTKNGQDAMLKIDGYDVVKSSNSFTIDGITYTLNDEYIPAPVDDKGISFSVTKNVETTVDKISKFVDSYNELVGKLQSMIGEDVHRSFAPLTDEQKEEMSEADIKTWEEKAKSGMVHNDSAIQALLTSVRKALFTTVEGTGMKLSDIGLTTGAYTDGAKITLNKDKLRTALENNPEAVANLFTKTSKSTDANTKFNESGFMVRVSDALLNYTSQATDVSLSLLQDKISDSKDQVDTLEDKLSIKSESLYKRFTAMEAAMAKLNSQSSWLSSLFSSNQSS